MYKLKLMTRHHAGVQCWMPVKVAADNLQLIFKFYSKT